MNNKFLIKEYFALCPDNMCSIHLLNEEEKRMKENGDMLLTGIIAVSERRNANGRIYPRHVLIREMENYQKCIKERRAVGELDHGNDAVINLTNTSHIITRAWIDGNDVYGVLKVLSTPRGQILRSLINDGVQVGISSRALGSLVETPQGSVVDDSLELICFDIVSTPSAPGAYLHLQESRDMRNKIFTKSDRIFRCLNSILIGNKDES